MQKQTILYGLIVTGSAFIVGIALLIFHPWEIKGRAMEIFPRVERPKELADKLFPSDVERLRERTTSLIDWARQEIDRLSRMPEEEWSFASVMQPLDRVSGALGAWGASLETLQMASPDEQVRDAAHQHIQELENFSIEHIAYNVSLYQVLTSCGERVLEEEDIADHQRRYIRDTLDAYAKRGLHLPHEQRQQAMEISKQLVDVTLRFERNIQQDKSSITATREQLAGVDQEFIQSLERVDEDTYQLTMDYPTYFRVMENVQVADTRYRMWKAFNNRAYPENREVLREIIALRDRFARLVGYSDYAHLDIDEQQMANSPERVRSFLDEMIDRTAPAFRQEFQAFKKNLPASVTLDAQGRLQPWDVAFVKNAYKKAQYDIDETELAAYFPLEHTLDKLLRIYETFFDITFTTVSAEGLWHEDVRCVQVHYQGELLGHIVMDLFPRKSKYSHAAQIDVMPRFETQEGTQPGVAFLIANFPKPQDDKPALLKRDDVLTFFHEFGHVLHTLFGATQLVTQSGTNVPTDFVELPSQMLEEWLYDTEILRQVSSHYQTGKPLPATTIEQIQKLNTYDAGHFVQRQAAISRVSLYAFGPGEEKDPDTILDQALSHLYHEIAPSQDNHFYAAFGHLTGYAAQYYSYLWSKVYAIDLFTHIRQHGLLNPAIGKQYAQTVLMPGGSADPMQLLKNFLGREPQRDAFYAYLFQKDA